MRTSRLAIQAVVGTLVGAAVDIWILNTVHRLARQGLERLQGV